MEDADIYHGPVLLEWDDEIPSDGIVATVIADIRQALGGMASPEDLIFHCVFLDSENGGVGNRVIVYGEEDSTRFYCKYIPGEVEWESISINAEGDNIKVPKL